MHRLSVPLLCLLLPTVAQESTVVTLLRRSWNNRLAASVVSANPTATTYSLGCHPEYWDGTTCVGYGNGIATITVVGGPSTAAETVVAEEGGATGIVTCTLTATAPYDGWCVQSDRYSTARYITSFKATANPEFAELATFAPVTVTGGLEKLRGVATGSGGGEGGPGASPTREGDGTASTLVPTTSGGRAMRVSASMFSVCLALLLGIW
jgi:hypothetical protein